MSLFSLSAITDVVGRFPRSFRLVVAHPIHQILKFTKPESGIEVRINLELREPVHLDGQGDLHDSARERVWHMRLEEADMDVHGR